jgi:hypothetical protein
MGTGSVPEVKWQGRGVNHTPHVALRFFFFFFFFFFLMRMLPETPQPYGLLYYPRIGHSNFLHQFRAVTPPKQINLEL